MNSSTNDAICDLMASEGNLQAELTQLREALAKAEGERDEWRDAVLDAAVVSWVPSKDKAPREIVNSLLAWEAQVALDPAVSEPMAKLVKERDTLQFQITRSDARLEKMLVAVRRVAEQRDELRHLLKDCTNDFIRVVDERDTLKAELMEAKDRLIANAETAGLQVACLEAQLTRAEEVRKLCAVQMMGLEEERGRLQRELSAVHDLMLVYEARAGKAATRLTTSREEGYRQATTKAQLMVMNCLQRVRTADTYQQAADIVYRVAIAIGDNLPAGSSTLPHHIVDANKMVPRTYEQGAGEKEK